jgi:hypothetical protein
MPIKKLPPTLNAAYLIVAPTISLAVFAWTHSTKQIGIITPFATRGGHHCAQYVMQELGRIEDEAGGGSVGTLEVMRAPKDGQFILNVINAPKRLAQLTSMPTLPEASLAPAKRHD